MSIGPQDIALEQSTTDYANFKALGVDTADLTDSANGSGRLLDLSTYFLPLAGGTVAGAVTFQADVTLDTLASLELGDNSSINWRNASNDIAYIAWDEITDSIQIGGDGLEYIVHGGEVRYTVDSTASETEIMRATRTNESQVQFREYVNGQFSFTGDSQTVYNTIHVSGFNTTPGGSQIDTSLGQVYMQMEHQYWTNATSTGSWDNLSEWWVELATPNRTDSQRVWNATIEWTTGYVNAGVVADQFAVSLPSHSQILLLRESDAGVYFQDASGVYFQSGATYANQTMYLQGNSSTGTGRVRVEGNTAAIQLYQGASGGWTFQCPGNKNLYFTNDSASVVVWTQAATPEYRHKGTMSLGGSVAAPASGASLDLAHTDKAFMPNRLTTAQRDALTPAAGMVVFNTDNDRLEEYNGTRWDGAGDRRVSSGAAATLAATDSGKTRVVTSGSTETLWTGSAAGERITIVNETGGALSVASAGGQSIKVGLTSGTSTSLGDGEVLDLIYTGSHWRAI